MRSLDLLSQYPVPEDLVQQTLSEQGLAARPDPPARERRRFHRLDVNWPVLIEGMTDALTRDMSCRGFFITSGRWFLEGEAFDCTVLLPAHDPMDCRAALALRTRATVVRTEALKSGGLFGAACRLEDCSVELVPDPHMIDEVP